MKSFSRNILILIISLFVAIPCLFFWCGTAKLYMDYQSSQPPKKFVSEFEKEKAKRDSIVIQRLEDIRTLQELHRDAYQTYCPSWADLIKFVKTDSVVAFLKEGRLTDEQLAMGLNERKTLIYLNNPEKYAKEIRKFNLDINRYAKKISVLDCISSKISNNAGQWIDRIQYIPIEEAKNDTFELKLGQIIEESGRKKPLFQVRVPYEIYLRGLHEVELKNKIAEREEMEKYPGLLLGDDKYDNNNLGNWE